MIGSLRGVILDRSTDGEVLIEPGTSGVGYRVVMAPIAAMSLGNVGDEVFIWVSHLVREDAQTLYGFSDRGERVCFEALRAAHGVGPALALAILSVHQPDELRRVLAEDDIDALCLVPGVGKKTATRLLIELKSRLGAGDLDPAVVTAGAGGPTGAGSTLGDVRAALSELGYSPDEITSALRNTAVRPDDDVSTTLRMVLQHLGTAR